MHTDNHKFFGHEKNIPPLKLRVCLSKRNTEAEFLILHRSYAHSTMRATSPTTRSFLPFCKFCTRSLNMQLSCFWFFYRYNPANPFVASKWRNVVPRQKRFRNRGKSFLEIWWGFMWKQLCCFHIFLLLIFKFYPQFREIAEGERFELSVRFLPHNVSNVAH